MHNINLLRVLLCACWLRTAFSTVPVCVIEPEPQRVVTTYQMQGCGYADLGKLIVAERLTLRNNELHDNTITIFNDYKALKMLDLENNNFKDCRLCPLEKLDHLESIRIREPATQMLPIVMKSLAKLKSVELELRKLDIGTINDLPVSLESLIISNTEIEDPRSSQHEFNFTTNGAVLQNLSLASNHLKRVQLLGPLPSLKYLNLASNDLIDLDLFMTPNPSLTTLNVSYNKIRVLRRDDLQKLPALEQLILRYNLVDTILPAAFEHNLKLQYVDLLNNHLKSIHLTFKIPSPKFQLILDDNPLNCHFLRGVNPSVNRSVQIVNFNHSLCIQNEPIFTSGMRSTGHICFFAALVILLLFVFARMINSLIIYCRDRKAKHHEEIRFIAERRQVMVTDV